MIAELARKYLCIPSISVPAERVFFTAGVIVNKLRSSLDPVNIDALIFLNQNLELLLLQLVLHVAVTCGYYLCM